MSLPHGRTLVGLCLNCGGVLNSHDACVNTALPAWKLPGAVPRAKG